MTKTLDIVPKEQIKTFRSGVMKLEEALRQVPGAVDDTDTKVCPLKHTFVNGAYVREIFMPKGTFLTSKIHKVKHPYFVMSGKCSVLTEKGVQKIEAPYHGITEPGTKRVLYIHEDCTWITVHVTMETDLEEIEKQIIAKDFIDFAITNEEFLKLKEE